MADHDQRFKNLLRAFFREFLLLFFPEWAARFDWSEVEWLDQEVFLDPPQGERRYLDLLAKLRTLEPVTGQRAGEADAELALIHVEIESADTVQPFRSRMYEYYEQARKRHNLPVLPIGLYLRVGMDGVGWDAYEEHFWGQRLLRFEYAYVGLPALDGAAYATGENLLGVALSALMRLPAERRAELYAEGLKRIAGSGENDYRRFLLAESLEAYAELDEAQKVRLQYIKDGVSVTPEIVREKMEAAAPAHAEIVHYEDKKAFVSEVSAKGIGFDWIKANASMSNPESERRDRTKAPVGRVEDSKSQ